MALAFNEVECSQWAEEDFGSIRLGDKRRTRRVVKWVEALAKAPGSTIPKQFDSVYDSVAVYDLLSRDEATPDALQQDHRINLMSRIKDLMGIVLLISDTTTLSFSGRKQIEGLGAVGDHSDGTQGFLLHSTIAARYCAEHELQPGDKRPPLEILGLAHQHYIVRPQDKRRSSRKNSPGKWNESFIWEENVGKVKIRNDENLRLVHVGDRESDIFDMLKACAEAEHGFVIRACYNRALDDKPGEHLFDMLRGEPSVGSFEMDLRARPGQAARKATLNLSFCQADLRAPFRKQMRSCGGAEPARVWAVRVWEESDSKNAIEWILLTDQEVKDFEQARQVVRIYSCRWVIEEFHKALKTGMGAEDLQLKSGHRLQAAVAVMSIVALRLLVMREKLKQDPEGPAEQAGVTVLELKVLRMKSKKPILTVKDAVYAIARLGGHFPHNGSPGWQTLWQGMKKLKILVEGAELFLSSKI